MYFVWSVIVMGEVVLPCSLVSGVFEAGCRFLGSGRMGDVGRSIAIVFCCVGVLLGKRLIVLLVS